MRDKTLVILAAGMGSRFGGMKQTYPVGPNEEFIMDYSIYSAIKYGFTKVVFVIREEYLDLFKSTIGARLEGKIKVDYAFQKLDIIPEGFSVPEGRVKPWGTAHAIYCAKDKIEGNFGVITADDFYGDIAFKDLSKALDSDNYSVIGYHIADTLSVNGAVKRGVVKSQNGIINEIIESSCILEGDKVKCTPLDTSKETFYVDKDNSVSMLMNGFTYEIITKIENVMKDEFEHNKDNLDTYEMLLPDIMDESIHEGKIINDIPTNSIWVGMTYKEDAEYLSKFIEKEIEKGTYPNNLWN
ncbi:MAG: nucleotidyltransferase [Firmicutes bacterium]|nr:nucleotidyltransferase [Bacillota bacterium]